MSYDSNGMAIGNAAKIAADLAKVAIEHSQDPGVVVATWAMLFSEVTDVVLDRQHNGGDSDTQSVTAAAQRIISTFNATAEPAPTYTPAPAPAPAAASLPPGAVLNQSGPAPIPQPGGASPLEQAWNMLFADAAAGRLNDNWWTDKKSAKHPDWKHKTYKLPGESYPVGLYRESRKNPPWVAARLAELGL